MTQAETERRDWLTTLKIGAKVAVNVSSWRLPIEGVITEQTRLYWTVTDNKGDIVKATGGTKFSKKTGRQIYHGYLLVAPAPTEPELT